MSQVIATEAPAANTPEWVEWRRGGLGASDLPAILGLDPYTTEHELWEVKTGRVPGFTGNARTRWGHRLERIGLDVWADATPDHLYPDHNDRPYRDDRWPHVWATPDAIARRLGDDVEVGIEVKVTSIWDDPPERVRVQALAQIGITGLARVDIVRLSFEDDPRIFPILRLGAEQAIEDILGAGEAWYVRHVVEGIEPPLAAGEVPADERQTALAAALRRVRGDIDRLERQESLIRDDLIASVAGRGLITGHGFRIRVTPGGSTTRVGWKEYAAELRQSLEPTLGTEALDEMQRRHEGTSTRRASLTPTWEEEETA